MKKLQKQQMYVLFFLFFLWNSFNLTYKWENDRNCLSNREIYEPYSANGNKMLNYSFFATYLGGNQADRGKGISVNLNGEMFITGETASRDFPTHNAYQPSRNGYWDSFITKLNPDQSYNYSTYLGGSQDETTANILSYADGSCIIAGKTNSQDFPIYNSTNSSNNGDYDVFYTKFTPQGEINFSSYFGGTNFDEATDMAMDPLTGAFFITGYTSSDDFPTKNAFKSSKSTAWDGYVTKFNPDGSLNFSTYLGGNAEDFCEGIAVDEFGICYVVGCTTSTNFPILNSPYPSGSAVYNAFLTKLSPNGTLVQSTLLGSLNSNQFNGDVSAGYDGKCVITGQIDSLYFPLENAYKNETSVSSSPIFVMKLNFDGTVNFSTYLGGDIGVEGYAPQEFADSVDLCEDGSCFITGITFSLDFPMKNAYQTEPLPNSFLTYFNSDGSLNYSTILGGSKYNTFYSLDAFSSEICFLIGETDSRDIKLFDPIDSSFRNGEAYVIKLLDPMADNDLDGLINIWEYYYGSSASNSDSDGDGISDGDEHDQGTDPSDSDSDGDGVPDNLDSNPTSFFYPTGLIMLVTGVGIGTGTVGILEARVILNKNRKKRISEILHAIEGTIQNTEYQQALEELKIIQRKIDKLKDQSLSRECELMQKECTASLSFLMELELPKSLIEEKKFQKAHASLVSLLKRANEGDYAEFLDKKLVSDTTELIKQVTEQIDRGSST